MTLVQCRHCRCCSSWCTLHFLDGNLVSFQCLSILLLCCMTRCEHVFDGPERIIVSHFGRNRVVLKCALVVPIPTLVIAQRVPRPGAPMHRGHFPMLDALSLVLCYSVPSVIELAKGLTSFGRSTFCCFCQQFNCSRQILFEPVLLSWAFDRIDNQSFLHSGQKLRNYNRRTPFSCSKQSAPNACPWEKGSATCIISGRNPPRAAPSPGRTVARLSAPRHAFCTLPCAACDGFSGSPRCST